FRVGECSLAWALEVRADVRWRGDPAVWIDLSVRDPEVPAPEAIEAPLAVGAARVEQLWRHVAGRLGWTFDAETLSTKVGAASIRVTRRQGDDGIEVVGVLNFPDLALGLHVAGRPWAARVLARHPEHVAVMQEIFASKRSGTKLLELTDDWARIVAPTTGMEYRALHSFCVALQTLSERLAREVSSFSLPEAEPERSDAWTAAARALDGELRAGATRIVGRRDGVAFGLERVWSEEVTAEGFDLVVDLDPPARGGGVASRYPRGESSWPEQLPALPRACRGARAEGDEFRVTLDADASLTAARSILDEMICWADRRTATGVYR